MGVIVRQGVKQTILRLLGIVVGFASFLFVYPLDHETYGYAQYLYSMAALLVPIVGLGVSQSVVKFFQEHKDLVQNPFALLNLAVVIHFVMFSVVLAIFFLTKEHCYRLINYFGFEVEKFIANEWLILALAYALTLSSTITFYISNFGRIVVPTLITDFGYKLFLPLLILLTSYAVIAKAAIGPLIISFFLTAFCLQLFYLLAVFGGTTKLDFRFFDCANTIRFAKYAIFSSLSTLGAVLAFRIDAVMITEMLSEEVTGLYFNILVMALIIDIPTQAIMKIAGPIISKSWTNGDTEEIRTIYNKSSKNAFIFGALVFLGIIFNLDHLIALSSNPAAFQHATVIFALLGAAKLFDAVTGVNNQIIAYSEHYQYNLYFLISLGVLNVVMNLYFIEKFGVVGAAIATAISLVCFNLLKLVFIKIKFEMWPFDRDVLIIASLAIATATVVYLLPSINNNLLAIFIKSTIITGLFAGSCYYFRVSSDINSLVNKYAGLLFKK